MALETFSPQQSNHIARVRYDADSRYLYIDFKNEAQSVYENVPLHVFREMRNFHSVGTYFHRVIKVHYRRVEHTAAQRQKL